MQNRRILNTKFAAAGISPRVAIETTSVLTLWAQVRSGHWSSVLSQAFLYLLGEPEGVRAIPLAEDPPHYTVGLVIPDREPLTPSARELSKLVGDMNLEEAFAQGTRRNTQSG
jgi:DNA-binding transcriptional LysR family regulator